MEDRHRLAGRRWNRNKEADFVSQRITKILSESGFSFTPAFIYGNAPDISATLDYDFGIERTFRYKGWIRPG